MFGLIPEERNRIESLQSLTVWSPLANKAVTLGSVISDVEVSYENEVIMRRDRRRVLTVASDVINGSNISEMQERIQAKIEAIQLPLSMLGKNSIVLLEHVASDFASGKDCDLSIVETGVSGLRPVAMSAVTTVLGMMPLIWDSMFGSMAVTIMGGLTVSTILTMVFIPVMIAVAYNVPNPDGDTSDDSEEKEVIRPVKNFTLRSNGKGGVWQYYGTLQGGRRVDLSFRVSWPVRSINVDKVASVKKGQLLAILDLRDYQT